MNGLFYMILIAAGVLAAIFLVVWLLSRRASKSKGFEEDFGRVGTMNAINQWRGGR